MSELRLGCFRLESILGRGGMGTVWEAVFEGPGAELLSEGKRRAAVKTLSVDGALRQDWREAFASEVQAIAALNHPHILSVFDFGDVSPDAAEASMGELTPGSPWLAMELADKGSLSRRRGLDWDALRQILLSLLDALAHAHARGLVHLDIKPANVLFAG